MKRRRAGVWGFLLLMALPGLGPGWVFGGEPQGAVGERPMSLKECVLIALQQAYDLQISAMSRDIAESQARAAVASYDPQVTASSSFSDVTAPGGFDTRTGTFVDSQSETVRASMRLSGLLPTGGCYSLGASVTDTEGTSGPFAFSNASGQGPFLEIRQPLLENLFIDDVRLDIKLSRQNLAISIYEFQRSLLGTINRVEEAYYDLVASKENVSVQEAAFRLAEELWKDNQKRVALGASAPLEEAETRSQAATSKAAVLSAQRQVRRAENVLKGAMVDDYAEWRRLMILPENTFARELPEIDFNVGWTLAQEGRPDLLASQVQMDQQEWILRRRGNQTLPELDLTASAGLAGSANELSQVYDQVRDRDAPFYSVGLSLALPLTNRRERENVRVAAAQAAASSSAMRIAVARAAGGHWSGGKDRRVSRCVSTAQRRLTAVGRACERRVAQALRWAMGSVLRLAAQAARNIPYPAVAPMHPAPRTCMSRMAQVVSSTFRRSSMTSCFVSLLQPRRQRAAVIP